MGRVLCSNRQWHGNVQRLSSSILALLIAKSEMTIPVICLCFYNLYRFLNGNIWLTREILGRKRLG